MRPTTFAPATAVPAYEAKNQAASRRMSLRRCRAMNSANGQAATTIATTAIANPGATHQAWPKSGPEDG